MIPNNSASVPKVDRQSGEEAQVPTDDPVQDRVPPRSIWTVWNPKPGSMAWKFLQDSPPFEPAVVPSTSSPAIDWSLPQAGTYFFYGPFQDPAVLRRVLGLSSDPVLNPAEVHDHALRRRGAYPALVHESEDEYDTVVQGCIYDVPDQDAAGKLQAYATEQYMSKGCMITVKDGDEERQILGWTFKFVGNRNQLSRGTWDLDEWRRPENRLRFTPLEPKVVTSTLAPATDWSRPQSGTYFFYGTLQDPGVLRQVLGLSSDPVLRPAKLRDYRLRLWGQYPALVYRAPLQTDAIVHGSVYDVPDQDAAEKLQIYETDNYESHPVTIVIEDGDEDRELDGWTFKFAGRLEELTNGTWNLDQWRWRTGRIPVSRPQRKTKSRTARR